MWTDSAGLTSLGFVDNDGAYDETGPMDGPPAAVTITVHTPATTQTIEVPEVRGAQPAAQPLPDGRVLLVGSSALWRPDGPDENATIYGPDGRAELTACVGDGVAQVRTTVEGSVWVGYDDTGIYGNNDWGLDGAPMQIGEPGLIRFSPNLEIEWEFPGPDIWGDTANQVRRDRLAALPGPIDDCSALTLDGDTLWMYYYSSFPVVRVDAEGDLHAWLCAADEDAVPVIVQALATDGHHVGLAGDSGETYEDDRVVIAGLEDGWTPIRSPRLVLPDGSRLPTGASMVGLGDTLHVFAGTEWYQVHLPDLV
ncbi:MAG: hypothetical protein ACJ72A_22235 [Nocardioidaceae bacterium]